MILKYFRIFNQLLNNFLVFKLIVMISHQYRVLKYLIKIKILQFICLELNIVEK